MATLGSSTATMETSTATLETSTTTRTSPTTTTAATATLAKALVGMHRGCEGEFAHGKCPTCIQCADIHFETIEGALLAKSFVMFHEFGNDFWFLSVFYTLDHEPK
jgi:hypothetical protein